MKFLIGKRAKGQDMKQKLGEFLESDVGFSTHRKAADTSSMGPGFYIYIYIPFHSYFTKAGFFFINK